MSLFDQAIPCCTVYPKYFVPPQELSLWSIRAPNLPVKALRPYAPKIHSLCQVLNKVVAYDFIKQHCTQGALIGKN